MSAMGGKWILLLALLGAVAAAQDDEEAIRKMFQRPRSLPGKFAYAEYQALLAKRGYRREMTPELDMRSYIASSLGGILQSPCTLRKIRFEKDRRRAVAVVDHGNWVQRWFLVRGEDRWRYYDFEFVDWGLRFSDGQNLPKPLQEAFNQYDGEEYRTAIRLLRKIEVQGLPETVQAFRHYLLARALWNVDDNEDALGACSEVAKLKVDLPGVHLLRAKAAYDAGEYDQAEPAARAYLAAFGEDAEGYYALGQALRKLDRRQEAVEAHLQGLKADDGSGGNVMGLLLALPDGRKKEAVPHFHKLYATAEWFDWIAYGLNESEDWAALATLLDAVREKHADHPQFAPNEARLALGRKRYREAAERILALLPSRTDEDRGGWARSYLGAMVQLNEPFQGYERLNGEERDLAWPWLAGSFADAKRFDDLEKLLGLRRKLDEPGATLPVWEIELLWGRKKYEEVAARVHESSDDLQRIEADAAWRPFDRDLRSLLRLKRIDDLLARLKERENPPFYLFMAYAAAGETQEAVEAFEAAIEKGAKPAKFYADPDAGPLLRSEAFQALREKYPQGK
jgi:hypothetical protein